MSLADGARVELPATAEAPGLARAHVRDALARFGLQHLEDEATLIVSEITTNAVIHGDGPIRLCVYVDSDLLFIEVEDSGSGQAPRLRHAGLDAESGRGLEIVESVAADWGVERLNGGVRVWASLNASPRFPETEPVDLGCPCGYADELAVMAVSVP